MLSMNCVKRRMKHDDNQKSCPSFESEYLRCSEFISLFEIFRITFLRRFANKKNWKNTQISIFEITKTKIKTD